MSSEDNASESGPAEDSARAEARKKFERTEKLVRRIGYVLLFGAGFAIFVPMVIGAIQGVKHDRIWDPFTGISVSVDDPGLECVEEAGDLIYLAGAHGEYDSRWEQRFRQWRLRCQSDEPEFLHVLTRTRQRLRGDNAAPELESGEAVDAQQTE